MKIYTRTGDDGTTGLFSGERVRKTHWRVDAYGGVDELNSVLGVARSWNPRDPVPAHLDVVQNQLFRLGADLATPSDTKSVSRISAEDAGWLEKEIDRMTAELPELRNFILPGGTPAAAQIHVARTICRRCEREMLRLAASDEIGSAILVYLNRLSDFLFTLARLENHLSGFEEQNWVASS